MLQAALPRTIRSATAAPFGAAAAQRASEQVRHAPFCFRKALHAIMTPIRRPAITRDCCLSLVSPMQHSVQDFSRSTPMVWNDAPSVWTTPAPTAAPTAPSAAAPAAAPAASATPPVKALSLPRDRYPLPHAASPGHAKRPPWERGPLPDVGAPSANAPYILGYEPGAHTTPCRKGFRTCGDSDGGTVCLPAEQRCVHCTRFQRKCLDAKGVDHCIARERECPEESLTLLCPRGTKICRRAQGRHFCEQIDHECSDSNDDEIDRLRAKIARYQTVCHCYLFIHCMGIGT